MMSHKILFQFTETKVNMKRKVHEMALEGVVAAVEAAVEANPEVVQKKDESGKVPFHWASSISLGGVSSKIILKM